MESNTKSKKGQVSIEVILIIGLVITLLIPTLMYVASSTYENEMKYAISQSNVVVSRLQNEINMVGATGSGSAMYVEVIVPPYVEHFNASEEGEVNIRLMTDAGPTDTFRITRYNIIANNFNKVRTGNMKFLIESINNTHVNLTAV